MLAFVAFLPFPTRLFADYIRQGSARAGGGHHLRDLPAALVQPALGAVAVRGPGQLVRPDAADEEVQLLTQRLTPGLAGYVALIVLGLFVPVIAVSDI